jgi:hypothetical protein
MRRGFLPVLVLLFLFAATPPTMACTRPYESAEHVLSRACYIAEVEILSVTGIEGEKRGERSKATVRVLRELRGKLPIRAFTLLGGRIDSCAPYATFLSFTEGERIFLFLEHAVPEETRTVRIFRAPRVFRGTAEDIDSMLERVHRGWSRRIELLSELAPSALEEARGLATAFRKDGAFPAPGLAEQPVEVLLALRELLLDPTAPLPRPAREAVAGGSPFTMEPSPSDPTEYLATFSSRRLPRELCDALKQAISAAPSEMNALRRAFLLRTLTTDLLVPKDRAEHFLTFLTKNSLLQNPSFPSWLRLTENASPKAREVLCLMKLGAPR